VTAEATVRRMTRADLAQVRAWRNDPGVRRFMLTRHEIGAEEHARWFDVASADPSRALLIVEAGAPLGYVQFSGLDSATACQWGFYAVPGAPRGTGSRLGRAALAYAFEQLHVHKVCGQAVAGNEASIRLHRHLGFRDEGVLRQQQRVGDAWVDLVCFGLLRSEWRSQASHQPP
jgi:UDP-4-amino-4,6-dideoxy-N-acetyl-beta-L-altrosamine N-acetyltransferase